jgi:hypothetical protein
MGIIKWKDQAQQDSRLGGYSYSRKAFYKINITTGRFLFNYADRSIETDNTSLALELQLLPDRRTLHQPINTKF